MHKNNKIFHCFSGYDGQQTCITYDAINQAYLEARNRIRAYEFVNIKKYTYICIQDRSRPKRHKI